ncbi:hypothetical protein M0R45_036008 [Rubus argutus]|uniref:Uncharacterized protein n=1 Tax=Rubus argutus TaxID=59490 RepID=A0AAW1VXC3_RUBAR
MAVLHRWDYGEGGRGATVAEAASMELHGLGTSEWSRRRLGFEVAGGIRLFWASRLKTVVVLIWQMVVRVVLGSFLFLFFCSALLLISATASASWGRAGHHVNGGGLGGRCELMVAS